MDKTYTPPANALKRLRTARELKQTVYIYGATGYGKTELVKQYLAGRKYHYFSCGERLWNLSAVWETGGKSGKIVVVDDLHLLKGEKERGEVLELAAYKDIWLILISRSPVPSWLMPLYVAEGFLIVKEEDLHLKKTEVAAWLGKENLALTEEELARLCGNSQGNAYVLRHTILLLKEGRRPGPELTEEIGGAFSDYLENYVLVQWDNDLLEFLMRVSVVDEFTLPLAEMIAGNCHVLGFLERAAETGNFISFKDDVYRMRPLLVKALRKRAAKVYEPQERKNHAYNAGLYYEMHGQIVQALAMFEQCGNQERIKELLVRNARRNPGNGHYFELRRYYLGLKEEEIEGNSVLMAGMSMLYSLLMQEEESEYWYKKLEAYAASAKGGQRREALSRLVYLDIALPHRGSADMIGIMKKVPSLLFDKGIELPEFSVTSNCPSTMNGGKDFCHWSKNDRKLAVSIGKLVEKVLGRYGKGLVKAALGESLYEKGEDTYEVLTLFTRARMEAESGGMMEIAFAAVGMQVRLNALHGELQTAKAVLNSFETEAREQGAEQLLPNISALRCRLALREGDGKAVKSWLLEAPDENREFCVLERYRYLTKARCYLFMGEYFKAQSLLEKLRYYAEKCGRPYIRMEVGLLCAMVKRQLGGEWKEELLSVLKEACGYRFLRLISEEGAAARELFEAAGRTFLEKELPDKEWLSRLWAETGKVAVRYPLYLKNRFVKAPDFGETALSVLRLQAEGKSVNQIAEELSMKAETVRYHIKENYRKLGVSGKANAVLAARDLGIL
ncbi:MAG: LuxR C-terminal-related transcriptional regulator [Clostridium sp.]|nr:LuxR C-terminal-related transcriptional regulator [Clostridium sp.]